MVVVMRVAVKDVCEGGWKGFKGWFSFLTDGLEIKHFDQEKFSEKLHAVRRPSIIAIIDNLTFLHVR